MGKDRPEGLYYSNLYLERTPPQVDSRVARERIFAFLNRFGGSFPSDFIHGFRLKFGDFDAGTGDSWNSLKRFFLERSQPEVLNGITVIYRAFGEGQYSKFAREWVDHVNEVLHDENILFEVDRRGGVHHKEDREFQQSAEALIVGLGDPSMSSIRGNVQAAYQELNSVNGNTRKAVEGFFHATESLFKQLFGEARVPDLKAAAALPLLKGEITTAYSDDPIAKRASEKVVQGYMDWIDAAHFYRHGQKDENSQAPPRELAVELMSTGASFMRWLLAIRSKRDI